MAAKKAGIDVEIGRQATAYGHIHFDQLRAIGLAPSTISDRCRAGKLIPVFFRVYAVGHVQRTPIAEADAAVLACGERTALSHDSTAALYGLRKWPAIPEVSSARRLRIKGIRTHQTATLVRADITVKDGIRVTTAARTIADIAPRLTDRQLVRAIHEARRNGDLPPAELRRLQDRCARAAQLVDPDEPASESQLDDYMREFFDARPWIPRPKFQVPWHGFVLDGLYEEHKLILEYDGRLDHDQSDRFESDRRRDALALELGHATIRITKRWVRDDPDDLERRLLAILAARNPDK